MDLFSSFLRDMKENCTKTLPEKICTGYGISLKFLTGYGIRDPPSGAPLRMEGKREMSQSFSYQRHHGNVSIDVHAFFIRKLVILLRGDQYTFFFVKISVPCFLDIFWALSPKIMLVLAVNQYLARFKGGYDLIMT